METTNYKNYLIKLDYDENCENPRAWDNIGTIYTASRDYGFGDENFYCSDELQEQLDSDKCDGDIIYPINAYIHSGITISLGSYNCRFDSGVIGYIRIPAEYAEDALEVAKEEIDTLDKYLRGEVFAYVIEDSQGNIVDSCSGYYSENDAINDAKDMIDCFVQHAIKNHIRKLKQQIKHKAPLNKRIALAI